MAAVNSTTLGSGASPSSHPVHRIRPPCPVTSPSGLSCFPFPYVPGHARNRHSRQPPRAWVFPSLLGSWDASGASIPSSMQPPVSRDTCISDVQDAQSGLGHTPNVNVTLQMQIPDLSTVTILISDSTTNTSTAHLPALALSRLS
ncbi:hypothetical protein CNYM01_08018 [Colletotrichum nymphaeae SA-01]|uniref:Uncharacterized protein n=1 Tax=Colletotrichum nymphaeae SA-01 TaxID=1460502 RepID=A0A135URY9_9PEZI|nr:hypothetical protein CNYM01_08018 [Colletotrichum nymphaeae SA-01]